MYVLTLGLLLINMYYIYIGAGEYSSSGAVDTAGAGLLL
jgi:hypothetical protein